MLFLLAYLLSFLFRTVASLATVSRDGDESKTEKIQSAAHNVHRQTYTLDKDRCVAETRALHHPFDIERRSLMKTCAKQVYWWGHILYYEYDINCFYYRLWDVCHRANGNLQEIPYPVVGSCQGTAIATNVYYYGCFAYSCDLEWQDLQVFYEYPNCDTFTGGATDTTSGADLATYVIVLLLAATAGGGALCYYKFRGDGNACCVNCCNRINCCN